MKNNRMKDKIKVTVAAEMELQFVHAGPGGKLPYVSFTGVDQYWRSGLSTPRDWTPSMCIAAEAFYEEKMREIEERRPMWKIEELHGQEISAVYKNGGSFRLVSRECLDSLIVALCKFKFAGEE